MCGIVGISLAPTADGDARRYAEDVVAALLHRGPDGSGTLGTARSAIGMSRLRVRSRPTEAVPFVGRDLLGEAYAFNGEVYLSRVGGAPVHVPEGGYGEAVAVARSSGDDLDGMYALVARSPDGTLSIARDELGIKPLYLRRADEGLAVASEAKALLDVFGPSRARAEAVFQFLLCGRVVDGGTFYEDVVEVQPGERLVVTDGSLRARQRPPAEVARAAETSPDAVRAAVSEAVRHVLVSDRQIGLAVSGGLDSTVIALELARAEVADVRTVSVLVEGTGDGVGSLADLGLPGRAWRSWKHAATTFRANDLLDGTREAVDALGEPSALTSMPLYLSLARRARASEIVVLLVGEGADELFGGYRTYLAIPHARSALEFFLPTARERVVSRLLDREALAAARGALVHALPPAADTVATTIRTFELEHSLRPLLHRADHMLMHQGIEGRTPFLHGSLPEIARSLPLENLVGGGQTKTLLRAAYANELPQFRSEAKRPFRAPLARWLAGPLRDRTSRYLLAHADLLGSVGISGDGLLRLVGDLGRADEETARAAYALVALAEWLLWLESRRAPMRETAVTA